MPNAVWKKYPGEFVSARARTTTPPVSDTVSAPPLVRWTTYGTAPPEVTAVTSPVAVLIVTRGLEEGSNQTVSVASASFFLTA